MFVISNKIFYSSDFRRSVIFRVNLHLTQKDKRI